ncbi:MAG TPA: 3-oxoacyl-[acyl-carrier-protein] reductase [Pseudogracilibacillus sp.]|nr:3-oxoacyl-[acyl-carrier-protein] reductase [Pseudogracilibacillus sp.]
MLKGKNAIVTGASRGIGRAIALELANQGANVVVNYAGNEKSAKKVVEELKQAGVKSFAIKANVADEKDVKMMMKETLKEFGTIDILVNNAGITRDNLLMRMKEADFDDVVDTNLKGTFLCIKAVSRSMMKQRSGRIINVASIVGVSGNPGQANYVAAKAGVIGLTKSVAQELASRNILVNAVAPGFIETDMTDELNEEQKATILKGIPLEKLGSPTDVARVVRFLASEDAAYLTGQTIHVDGGMVM